VPGTIPIRNLYYLFLYAWDRFPEGRAIEAGATGGPDVLDLFARVLANGVRRLLRRGVDRGYLEAVEETAAPRGRILLADTLKRAATARGSAVCSHDELAADVPHNQILKATLRTLAAAEGLDPGLAHDLVTLHRRLVGVSDMPLTPALFRRVQLSRNSRHYDLLLHVCRLALDRMLPGEGSRRARFADVLEDEARMSAVFEAFVRNFYKSEQDTFEVRAERIDWDAGFGEPSHARHLPSMRTDAVLRSADRTIVIDAKFYRQTLVRHMGGEEKVRSAHLYQLLTYLRHIRPAPQSYGRAEGVLLYPRIDGRDLRLEYALAGHRVRIRTLALDRDWREVHDELLELVASPISGRPV
jgi:5-methylcytosine-specific restriction enzyme subunit McrC